MEQQFQTIINEHKGYLKQQDKIVNIIGNAKLLSVVVLSVFVYFMFTKGFTKTYIVCGVVNLIIVVGLFIYHNWLCERIEYSKGIIAINEHHLERISGKWAEFSDIGEEFIDYDHAYACDLDIVGKKSLFQLLNTTNTWFGRQAFAEDLLSPSYSKAEMEQRQQAISELSKELEFTNQLEYYTSKIGNSSSAKKMVEQLKDKTLFIKNRNIRFILLYGPVVVLAAFMAAVIFKWQRLYLPIMVCIIAQAVVWCVGARKIQAYLSVIGHLPYRLSTYSTVIKLITEKEFTSFKLKEISRQLGTSEQSAEHAIKELGRIAERYSIRSNPILYFLVNIFDLWDYECVFRLEDWKQKYADTAEKWFLALGEFESLMSFANLPRVCNNVTLPKVLGKSRSIQAKGLGHPLINNEVRVTNDVVFDNAIFIISGSNMSGKTTFLRTMGINLVLARCGSFVCAGEMAFSPMRVMSSMRIADDLNEGISTFYAELKRIKGIIELAKKEPNTMFLIDEIFRGTNSVDRLCGAKAVLTKLNDLRSVGIITTHDLELCELARQSMRIKNFSFSEYYKDRQIHFDYKIKAGKSTTTNAKFLMELVGI